MLLRVARRVSRPLKRVGTKQTAACSSSAAAEQADEFPSNFVFDEDCDLFEFEPPKPFSEAELSVGKLITPTLPVFSVDDCTSEVGSVNLDKRVWGVPIRRDIIHRMVCWQRAGWRQGTSKTKSRGEVRGGGAKPWAQKGTGRARHGSIRSPIWRGGGHAHAKKPRDWSHKLNRKLCRMGLRVALSAKCLEGKLVIIDNAVVPEPKTREVTRIIDNYQWGEDQCGALLLDDPVDEDFALACRNIPQRLFYATSVEEMLEESNVYDIVLREHLVLTVASFNRLQEALID